MSTFRVDLERSSLGSDNDQRPQGALVQVARAGSGVNPYSGGFTRYVPRVPFAADIGAGHRAPLAVALHQYSPTVIVCDACWRENVKENQEHHFCAHCGSSLRTKRDLDSLPVSKKENVAIIFIKLSDYNSDNPEETALRLERFRSVVGENASMLGGISKFDGDEGMMVFGALDDTPVSEAAFHNANRALQAWKLIESQLGINRMVHEGDVMHVAGGAHLGEVVVGPLGVMGEKNYDVLGNDVNFAARVASSNHEKSGLVLSLPFYDVLRDSSYSLNFDRSTALKGFGGRHEIYRLGDYSYQDLPNFDYRSRVQNADTPTCLRHAESRSPYCPYCGNKSLQNSMHESEVAQNRSVTIMSIDMVGFSTESKKLSPDKVFEWVDSFYGVAEPWLTRHHGEIIARKGDEILVRFGVPSFGNSALNAALAAVGLQDALAKWNSQPQDIPPIHVRVGIARGDALIKGKITAGDVVSLSRKWQALAPLDGILIDQDTYESIEDCFTFIDHPAGGYELKEARTQFIDFALRRSSQIPLVGREEEVLKVNRAFEKSQTGDLRVRLLVGALGSGHHAIVDSFLENHRNDIVQLSGRSHEWQSDPLRDAFRNMLNELDGVFSSDQERLQAWLRRLNIKSIIKELPYGFATPSDFISSVIGRFMGLDMADSEGMRFLRQQPHKLYEWTVKVVSSVLELMSHSKPVVMDLRDLHQADTEALRFLTDVLGRVSHSRIFLLGTSAHSMPVFQEVFEDGAVDVEAYQEIDMGALDDNQALRLIKSVLEAMHAERKSVDGEVLQFLQARSAGHPLYLVELTRAAVQRGIIFWNDTTKQWERNKRVALDSKEIPISLNEALLARLDHLSASERKIFQVISCLADDDGTVWLEPLLDVVAVRNGFEAPITRSECQALIALLEKRGLLTYNSASLYQGWTSYQVTPALLAEAQYQSIPQSVKRDLHARFYQWLSNDMRAGRFSHEKLGLRARQAFLSGNYPEAFADYKEALAMVDKSISDQRAAALYYSHKAEECLDVLDAPNKDNELFDLLLSRSEIYSRTNAYKEAWDQALKKLEAISLPESDAERRMKVVLARGDYKSKFDPGYKWYEEMTVAWEEKLQEVDSALAARFYFNAARSYSIAGRFDEAVKNYDAAFLWASRCQDQQVKAKILFGLSSVYLRQGQHQKSLLYAEQALPILEAEGSYNFVCYCLINMYVDYFHLDRLEDAARVIGRAYDLSAKIGDQEAFGYSCLNEGILMAYRGQERALSIARLEQAIQVARDSGLKHMLAVALYTRGLLLAEEDPARTIIDAQQSLACSSISDAVRATAYFVMAVGQWRQSDKTAAVRSMLEAFQMKESFKGPLNDFDAEFQQVALWMFRQSDKVSELSQLEKYISTVAVDQARQPSPLIKFLLEEKESQLLTKKTHALKRVRLGSRSARATGTSLSLDLQGVQSPEPKDVATPVRDSRSFRIHKSRLLSTSARLRARAQRQSRAQGAQHLKM